MMKPNRTSPVAFACRLMLLMLVPLLAACGDDDPPAGPEGGNGPGGGGSSSNYFAGKAFTGEPIFISAELWNVDWWIISFDGNSGSGYDGYFSVVPYYDNGDVVGNESSFYGKYSVDWKQNRIYVTFNNGGTAFWTFREDPDQENYWPHWKPSLVIEVPANSTAPFAGVTFFPGNVFDDPDYDEDIID